MTAVLPCDVICGWESGHINESGCLNDNSLPTGFSVVTPPSPPTGIAMGNYCLLVDSIAMEGGAQLMPIYPEGPITAAVLARGLSVLWRPATNPTVLGSFPRNIIAFRGRSSGGGYGVAWGEDKKLKVVDLEGVDGGGIYSTLATSANAYDAADGVWRAIATRYEKTVEGVGGSGSGAIWVAVYDMNRALIEEFVVRSTKALPGTADQAVIIGSAATGASWHLDNLYVTRGSGYYPPIAPSVVATPPTSTSTNATQWMRDYDSGTANAAVTTTNTTLTDTRENFATNGYFATGWVGAVVTCNAKTMTVTSVTTTTNPNDTLNGTAWSGGGNPGNGKAYVLRFDNATNEWPTLDEIPPNDSTDFILKNTFATHRQFYGHAAGLVPAGNNVLACAVMTRVYAADAMGTQFQFGADMKLTTQINGRQVSPGQILNQVGPGQMWYFQVYVASSAKPGGGAWTVSDVDNVEMGNSGQSFSGAAEGRCSQVILYAAYGPDWPLRGPIQRESQSY